MKDIKFDGIVLIVGKSGSGKSTIAEMVARKLGINVVQSYTTRPKRYETEKGHIFLDLSINGAKAMYPNRIAETIFCNHFYFTTPSQFSEPCVYVIDPAGVKSFMKRYKGDKHIHTIYIGCNIWTRAKRMRHRADSITNIIKRLFNDEFSGFNLFKFKADILAYTDKAPSFAVADSLTNSLLEANMWG